MYKEIIKITFEKIFLKNQRLIKALLIPLLILMALEVYAKDLGKEEIINIYEIAFIMFLSLIVNVFIAITTHRILLLGEESVPVWGSLSFSKREFSYFFNTFLLALIVISPILLVSFISDFFVLASVVVSIILYTRLSLVFPAISIDEPISFKQSWELTKDYKFLTFITLVLAPGLLALFVGLAYSFVIEFLMKVISPSLHVLQAALSVFITVFIVGFLSSTYMYIRTQRQDFFN